MPVSYTHLDVYKRQVLVLSGAGSGYMLTNRVLGADREAFWSFVQSKVEQNR